MKEDRARVGLRISKCDNKKLNELADIKGFNSKNCFITQILKEYIEKEESR